MAEYLYPTDDNKLHTRYSELAQVTPVSAQRIVRQRMGLLKGFSNESTAFGTIRHELWNDEIGASGKLPECFGIDAPVHEAEQEIAAEIFKDVILHSRPDAVSLGDVMTIWDFKTMIFDPRYPLHLHAKKYASSRQLPTYVLQYAIKGTIIKRYGYLVEVWNKGYTEIKGYSVFIKDVTIADLGDTRIWLLKRVEILKVAEQLYKEKLEIT